MFRLLDGLRPFCDNLRLVHNNLLQSFALLWLARAAMGCSLWLDAWRLQHYVCDAILPTSLAGLWTMLGCGEQTICCIVQLSACHVRTLVEWCISGASLYARMLLTADAAQWSVAHAVGHLVLVRPAQCLALGASFRRGPCGLLNCARKVLPSCTFCWLLFVPISAGVDRHDMSLLM